MLPRIALLALVALVLFSLGAFAQWADPPIILHAFPEGDELVIQGMYLSLPGRVEPTVTLGDAFLTVASFSPREIRALLPAPPLEPGTHLLTVEKITGIVGACDVTLSAADLSCIDCVSAAELDFDPTTQDDLTDHAALPDVHHTPPTELPPSGAAGGDLTGRYPDPIVRENAVTAAKVDSTEVQLRVSGACPEGASIRQISTTGQVTCEADNDTTLNLVLGGEVIVERENNQGRTTKLLGNITGRRACFLTRVEVEETDTGSESAGCWVYRSGGGWYLEAYLGKSSDADVFCGARCLSW